ncbi:unnamed protein product [Ectocarpus fasciculatus]
MLLGAIDPRRLKRFRRYHVVCSTATSTNHGTGGSRKHKRESSWHSSNPEVYRSAVNDHGVEHLNSEVRRKKQHILETYTSPLDPGYGKRKKPKPHATTIARLRFAMGHRSPPTAASSKHVYNQQASMYISMRASGKSEAGSRLKLTKKKGQPPTLSLPTRTNLY